MCLFVFQYQSNVVPWARGTFPSTVPGTRQGRRWGGTEPTRTEGEPDLQGTAKATWRRVGNSGMTPRPVTETRKESGLERSQFGGVSGGSCGCPGAVAHSGADLGFRGLTTDTNARGPERAAQTLGSGDPRPPAAAHEGQARWARREKGGWRRKAAPAVRDPRVGRRAP